MLNDIDERYNIDVVLFINFVLDFNVRFKLNKYEV